MKKSVILLPIIILTSILHIQTLFAQRDDEANKCYLDAYNLYKLGKLDQSLEMLKKVIEINPDHAEAHFGMGSIYFRQNMFDDAVKEFTKVTRIKPEYVEAYQRLWLAYKKLGMNDKAEEELQKYKKLIEERMQGMVGGSPQVVKPAAPPPRREVQEEKPKPEETQPTTETRPPETTVPDTRVAESGSPEKETEKERPVVVKPVSPPAEETKPVAGARSSVAEPEATAVLETTKQIEKRYTESPPQPPTEEKRPTETEYKSPYIKVDKKDPAYKHLFKPFKKVGSTLFKNPFKKRAEELEKTYVGKLVKGFLYYIMTIQIWLCIVAFLGIYFFKAKKEKL
ncbi:MAG: tetratricopeptide repeat protein [Candidatus Brocadia sp.]|nr:tetratricopeptide repeat protein [Candidatus Brocadia sp.]